MRHVTCHVPRRKGSRISVTGGGPDLKISSKDVSRDMCARWEWISQGRVPGLKIRNFIEGGQLQPKNRFVRQSHVGADLGFQLGEESEKINQILKGSQAKFARSSGAR